MAAGMVVAALAVALFPVLPAHGEQLPESAHAQLGLASDSSKPTFTFERILGAQEAARTASSERLGLSVQSLDGEMAIVDASLVRPDGTGAASAANPRFVDLSWSPVSGAERYVIVREGKVIGSTTSTAFRDTSVAPGDRVSYSIDPLAPIGATLKDPVLRGLAVVVPTSSANLVGLTTALDSRVQELAYTYVDLDWVTFIPEARIDAPPVGVPGVSCEYQSGYQFGGDNRGFASSPYWPATHRTDLFGFVVWRNDGSLPQVSGASISIGETRVYNKSTGALVDSRYLAQSAAIKEFYALGRTATAVDLRMGFQAGNPFCSGNSIEGAMTLSLTAAGNWAILSGEHRQMPSHEVFITTSSHGSVRIYQRSYANALCLVNMACPSAPMSGVGTYM